MNNSEPNTPMSGMSNERPKSSWGPAVGLIIILILIIAGSFYFFKSGSQPANEPQEPSVADIEDDLMKLEEQGESDELESVEKDLQDTDLTSLDQEMGQVEQEVSQLDSEL